MVATVDKRKREVSVYYAASVWDYKKVLEIDGGDGCTKTNVFNATELCTKIVKVKASVLV